MSVAFFRLLIAMASRTEAMAMAIEEARWALRHRHQAEEAAHSPALTALFIALKSQVKKIRTLTEFNHIQTIERQILTKVF